MDNNVKVIFDKFQNVKFNKGYIDLNNTKISSNNDLAEICDIFRDYRYETFRIFYMKNNKIVGQEYITSRIPNVVNIFYSEKNTKNEFLKSIEKMKYRIKRLNADGYYMLHNHTSESSNPSKCDMDTTAEFIRKIDGFLGHIVIGNSNRYTIINKDEYGLLKCTNEQILNREDITGIEEKLKDKTMYDVKISNQSELVALLSKIQNSSEYSIAVLTDCKCNVRMVLDIPNRMFNSSEKELNGFFKNIARTCGGIRVFIGTKDKELYEKIGIHQEYGTIKDYVYLEFKNGELNLYENKNTIQKRDLFDTVNKNKHKDREI